MATRMAARYREGLLGIITLFCSGCSQASYKDSIQRELNYVNAIPFVRNITPSASNTDVDVNATIVVDFGSAMNISTTASAFSLNGPTGSIAGLISWQNGNATLVFTPNNNLVYKTSYIVKISSSAKTQFGTAMPTTYSSNFTTNGNIYVTTTGNNTSGDGTKARPYLTIQYSIDQAKAKSATDVLVAAGDYNEQITMRKNVSLRGGFHPTTWTRDWNVNVSRVKVNISGINFSSIIKFPAAEAIGNETKFEGLYVRLDTPTLSTGYIMDGSYASPEISYCNFQSVSPNGSDITIIVIMYFSGFSNPIIKNNYLNGTAQIIYGIQLANESVVRIEANQIALTGYQSIFGVIANSSASVSLNANIIKTDGSDAGSQNSPIYLNNSFGNVTNNIIHAGFQNGQAESWSMTINGVPGTVIVSNNLFMATGSWGNYGLNFQVTAAPSPPFIYNNIFLVNQNLGASAHIISSMANIDYAAANNNVFFGASVFYQKNSPATQITTLASMPNAANNISVDPQLIGSGNYHFSSSSPLTVTGGGLDTSTGPFGFVTTDYDGNPRTCPVPGANCYSMGPYEKDN